MLLNCCTHNVWYTSFYITNIKDKNMTTICTNMKQTIIYISYVLYITGSSIHKLCIIYKLLYISYVLYITSSTISSITELTNSKPFNCIVNNSNILCYAMYKIWLYDKRVYSNKWQHGSKVEIKKNIIKCQNITVFTGRYKSYKLEQNKTRQ